MSTQTTAQQTGNALLTNYNVGKTFIGHNRYQQFTYTNSTGSEVSLAEGTLMGLIYGTNKVVPLQSSATNGSQVPIGILKTNKTVANGASATVNICVAGEIAAENVTYDGSDTAATAISLTDSGSATVVIGTINSLLLEKGIYLFSADEMTAQDNQPS